MVTMGTGTNRLSPIIYDTEECRYSEGLVRLVQLYREFPKGQTDFSLPIPQRTEENTMNVNVMCCPWCVEQRVEQNHFRRALRMQMYVDVCCRMQTYADVC